LVIVVSHGKKKMGGRSRPRWVDPVAG